MKHLFIALTIAAASLITTAKASSPITPTVLESFRSTYGHAKDVYWTEIGNTYKIAFKLDGKSIVAYYTNEGVWIGTTRNISAAELSPKLRANLSKEMKTGYISDLFILSNPEGETYFATIETADTKKVVKSNNGRKWDFYKRIEK
jgi:maleate cis-trans isomerase